MASCWQLQQHRMPSQPGVHLSRGVGLIAIQTLCKLHAYASPVNLLDMHAGLGTEHGVMLAAAAPVHANVARCAPLDMFLYSCGVCSLPGQLHADLQTASQSAVCAAQIPPNTCPTQDGAARGISTCKKIPEQVLRASCGMACADMC